MSSLRALWITIRVYAVGAAVLCSQLLRRLRGGFREPALPRQPGRVAIVTGGTDGIGFETARQLARLGMRVVIAGNDAHKAQDVVRRIREETSDDKVHFLFCDLASLTSVRKFARDFLSTGFPLHVLVNNAGVMLGPTAPTEDGFERHLGVNFLGHFLLTHLLLDALRAAGSRGHGARVVTVTSATHYVGELDPEGLRAACSATAAMTSPPTWPTRAWWTPPSSVTWTGLRGPCSGRWGGCSTRPPRRAPGRRWSRPPTRSWTGSEVVTCATRPRPSPLRKRGTRGCKSGCGRRPAA